MRLFSKPSLIILCLNFIFVSAGYSQKEIGVKGGVNLSKMNFYFSGEKVKGQSSAIKSEMGMFFKIPIKARFHYIAELNFLTSGIVIEELDYKLNAKSIEHNSILQFDILQSSVKPAMLFGLGVNNFLNANAMQNGVTQDLDLEDEFLNRYGIGIILGAKISRTFDKLQLIFESRFRKGLNNFITDGPTEDFKIDVNKQEISFVLGISRLF